MSIHGIKSQQNYETSKVSNNQNPFKAVEDSARGLQDAVNFTKLPEKIIDTIKEKLGIGEEEKSAGNNIDFENC